MNIDAWGTRLHDNVMRVAHTHIHTYTRVRKYLGASPYFEDLLEALV